MKTLILVRHAEATNNMGLAFDKARALTSGGMIDAARMGKQYQQQLSGIQHLISSPAERTQMTAQVLAEQIGFDFSTLEIVENLYEGSPRHYLGAINGISEQYEKVMLVGHNPSITYLAEYLCHEELGNIPTCGIVGITFENLQWAEVSSRSGKKIFYESPDGLIGY